MSTVLSPVYPEEVWKRRLLTWEDMKKVIEERENSYLKAQNELAVTDDAPNGTVFKVIVDEIPPYIILGNGEFTGYIGDIWAIVGTALNISTEFQRANFTTGKDLVQSGQSDISLIPVVLTTTDITEFGFSFPIVKTWYGLFMKASDDGASSMSYLVTWSKPLWLAFTITIFILTAAVWFILKFRSPLKNIFAQTSY